jgi:hypothetical protein
MKVYCNECKHCIEKVKYHDGNYSLIIGNKACFHNNENNNCKYYKAIK